VRKTYEISFLWRGDRRRAYVVAQANCWEVFCKDDEILNQVAGCIIYDQDKKASTAKQVQAKDALDLYLAIAAQLH
jgi:hypothetical protein